ncbi:hypothetical protein PAMA_011360 [Pampus argenteus]
MAQDMTLLWGSGSPPCWRVMIALEEKNLQGYNQKLLSFQKMEHKSQEVMDMNPRGQLPSFKHGTHVLNESYAACMYLEVRTWSLLNIYAALCSQEMNMWECSLCSVCVQQCLADKRIIHTAKEKKPDICDNSSSFHVSNNRASSSLKETS